MDLTDKKYPNYINLARMVATMDMYNNLGTNIWNQKQRRLRPIVEDIRVIWDDCLSQRNINYIIGIYPSSHSRFYFPWSITQLNSPFTE